MCYVGKRLAAALLLAAPVLPVGPMCGVGRLTPKFSCERFYYHCEKDSIIGTLEERSTQRLTRARLLQLPLGGAAVL